MRADESNSIRALDGQLLRIMDAAFADSARRSGEHLVCHPGCTQCCHGAFAINALDAMRLREGMAALRVAQPDRAAAVEQRAAQYLSEYGPGFPGDVATGMLGQSDDEQAAFEEFANDAACPALEPETGLCAVYDARPMTCRVFGPPVRAMIVGDEDASSDAESDAAFAVCELCFTEATPQEIEAAEMLVPHDEEERVLAVLEQSSADPVSQTGETIVAFCLLP